MNKTEFTDFPFITADEPMADTNFWQFIETMQYDNFVACLTHYLTQYGFNKDLHKFPLKQIDRHRSVHSHYWWTKLRKKK